MGRTNSEPPSPAFVFVPGFWLSPAVFDPARNLLEKQYQTTVVSPPSLGTKSPGNPTMDDDVAAIRAVIKVLVDDEGKDVILVLHSSGGVTGCGSFQGLTAKERGEKGLGGGVVRIVLISAGVLDEGETVPNFPWFIIRGPIMTCDPAILLNDVAPEVAAPHLAALDSHPSEGWATPVKYCGWRDVPSTYVLCELDKMVSLEIQQAMAMKAGSDTVRVQAGHVPMVGKPDDVVRILISLVGR